MAALFVLRLTVFQVDDSAWCPACELACAVRIVYVEEVDDQVATGVTVLTYCQACESVTPGHI